MKQEEFLNLLMKGDEINDIIVSDLIGCSVLEIDKFIKQDMKEYINVYIFESSDNKKKWEFSSTGYLLFLILKGYIKIGDIINQYVSFRKNMNFFNEEYVVNVDNMNEDRTNTYLQLIDPIMNDEVFYLGQIYTFRELLLNKLDNNYVNEITVIGKKIDKTLISVLCKLNKKTLIISSSNYEKYENDNIKYIEYNWLDSDCYIIINRYIIYRIFGVLGKNLEEVEEENVINKLNCIVRKFNK